MPIEVELPNGTIAEFPDGMAPAQIEAVLARQFPPSAAAPAPAELPIVDFPTVRAVVAPEDMPWAPTQQPQSASFMLQRARETYPELVNVPDGQLLAAIRQEVYPDVPIRDFYRDVGEGWAERLGDTSDDSPTQGMSGGRRFFAGLGKAYSDTGRGLKQFGTEVIREAAGDRTGLTDGDNAITRWADRSLAQQQREIDDAKRLDTPLVRTGAGLSGNIAGYGTQLIGPGVLARGTVAGRALLPTTLAGNTAQGVAMGAIQPVATGESRAVNAGVSGLLGGAAYGLPAAVGAASRGVASLTPTVSRPMQERAAAELLERFATNPVALRAAATNPEQILAGSMPTLAEASGDTGLAQLQRVLQNEYRGFGADLAERQAANNQARVGAIEQAFGGASKDAAESARAQTRDAAAPVLREIRGATGAQGGKVTRWIDRTMNSTNFRGNPEVEQALGRVRQLVTDPVDDASRISAARGVAQDFLAQPKRLSAADFDKVQEARRLVWRTADNALAPDDLVKELGKIKAKSLTAQGVIKDMQRSLKVVERGKQDVASLYNARKHITANLMPRASGETMVALRGAVQQLDNQILEVAPSYRQYLTDYAAGMRRADQAEVGARLLRGSNAVTDADGVPVLNSQYLNRARDIDATVRGATGFDRARANRTLTGDQLKVVDQVRRDLERQMRTRDNARAVGSNTRQNFVGAADIRQELGPLSEAIDRTPVVNLLTGAINSLRKTYGQRTMDIVQDVMLNPERAADILGRLPTKRQRAVMSAIRAIPRTSGTVVRSATPALTEQGVD